MEGCWSGSTHSCTPLRLYLQVQNEEVRRGKTNDLNDKAPKKPIVPICDMEQGFMYDYEQFCDHKAFSEIDNLHVCADDDRVVVLIKWVEKHKVIATYKREYP